MEWGIRVYNSISWYLPTCLVLFENWWGGINSQKHVQKHGLAANNLSPVFKMFLFAPAANPTRTLL